MQRCLSLAKRGSGLVAPNPMVGAVLVHDGEIIGEGWHGKYGGPHAEVNCFDSVSAGNHNRIGNSRMYVSLEPCAHFGKTPPCADRIIHEGVPEVFIGCRDPFIKVDGRGIEKLERAGIIVRSGILERECREMNRRFLIFHEQKRPYIILKWAETADHKIASHQQMSVKDRLYITSDSTNRIIHKWRSEEAAILVGSNTARLDDPTLNTRLWPGPSPVRIVIDPDLELPSHLKLLNDGAPTIIFNNVKHEADKNIQYYQVANDVSMIVQIMNGLYSLNIQSVLVEGGLKTLQSFIDGGIWDEARVITNNKLFIGQGISAPQLSLRHLVKENNIEDDIIRYYRPG
jgi:diaminohydroxyphosphoribosylaminopyrimidine deaminase/5-amino-6-(5-phosphoribosylamino)uracil reductase